MSANGTFNVFARNNLQEPWKWVAQLFVFASEAEAVAYAEKVMAARTEEVWKVEKSV